MSPYPPTWSYDLDGKARTDPKTVIAKLFLDEPDEVEKPAEEPCGGSCCISCIAEGVVDEFLEFAEDETCLTLLGGEGTDYILACNEEMSLRAIRDFEAGIRAILEEMVEEGIRQANGTEKE